MNRINSSRQTTSAMQRNCNYHPSNTIAAHVLASTIAYESSEQVLEVEAGNSEQVGRLFVTKGQRLYIVASKFTGRYYIVVDDKCSSFDDRVCAACIAKVQAYRIQQEAMEIINHPVDPELSAEDQAAIDRAAAQPDIPFDLEEMAALAQAMREFQAVPSYCERFVGGYFDEEE